MSSAKELYYKITDLSEQVKNAEDAKLPKEVWDHILQELLAAKAEFKSVTGRDYRPPPEPSLWSCCFLCLEGFGQ